MEKFHNERKFKRNSKYKKHTGPRVSNLMKSVNDNHYRSHRKKMKRYSHKVYRQELNYNLEDSKNFTRKHYSYNFRRSQKISEIIRERIEEKKISNLNYVNNWWNRGLSLYLTESKDFINKFNNIINTIKPNSIDLYTFVMQNYQEIFCSFENIHGFERWPYSNIFGEIILKNNECNFIELFSRNGFLSFKVYDYYVNSFEQNYYLRCGYRENYKPKYPNLKINIETYGCPNTFSWYPFIGKEHDDIKWENYDDYNVILSHESDDNLNKIQMFEKVINSSKFNCKNILLFSNQLNFNLDISKKYNICYQEDLKLANSSKYGTYIIYNKID